MMMMMMMMIIMMMRITTMMKVLMMTMGKAPDDEVKLSKVEANVVDAEHLILRAQLGTSVVMYMIEWIWCSHYVRDYDAFGFHYSDWC